MRTPQQSAFLDLVRQANLIETVIAEDVALRQEGKLLVGRCPLHGDTDASLKVYPENQSYYCFGCGSGGDVFAWTMALRGLSFVQALDHLADRAGIVRKPLKPEEAERLEKDREVSRQAQTALQEAAAFYEQRLWGPTGGKAMTYLKGRGFTEETIRKWHIGWAPGGQELQRHLALKQIPIEAMQRAGLLASYSGANGYYDLLNQAVVVPITEYHRVVSLYGRLVDPPEKGSRHRYLNGRTNTGLFNWDQLRGHKEAVLTEAILDAVSFDQVGFHNVTVAYGTLAFTEDHAIKLKNLGIEKVTLAFDSDPDTDDQGKEKKSGQKAALDLAGQLTQLGFDVRIASWPRADSQSKLDANQYLQSGAGPAEFQQVLDAALPPAEFRDRWQVDTDEPLLAVRGPTVVFHWGAREYHADSVSQTEEGMRATVTLYVDGRLVHRDTLGLYSAQRRNQYAKHCQGLDAEDVNRDLLALEAELQKFTAKRLEAEEAAKSKGIELSEEDKAEAMELLLDPQMLRQIDQDLTTLGYIGEEANKIMMYLVATSRKLDKPMSAVVKAQSSSGKSALIEKVINLMPPEDIMDLSRTTPQALFYMERDALKNKWVVIMERNGSEEADYAIRTMQSEKMLKLAIPIKNPRTGQMSTQVLEVEGPMAYAESTTQPAIHPENATRAFDLYINESESQTQQIQAAQRKARTLAIFEMKARAEIARRRHQNAQRLLEPVSVIIPYAELLEFPSNWVRTRRDNDRFLDLIATIAFLHQFQRERQRDDELGLEYIEATHLDYTIAYGLAGDVLAQTLDEVPKQSRELLLQIRQMVEAMARKKGLGPHQLDELEFTRKGVRQHAKATEAYVRRYIEYLVEFEFLSQEGGGKGRAASYRYIHRDDITRPPVKGLLSPTELEERMKQAGLWPVVEGSQTA